MLSSLLSPFHCCDNSFVHRRVVQQSGRSLVRREDPAQQPLPVDVKCSATWVQVSGEGWNGRVQSARAGGAEQIPCGVENRNPTET